MVRRGVGRHNPNFPGMHQEYDGVEGFDLLEGWPGVYQPNVEPIISTVKIIDELKRRAKHTPDFSEMRLRESILLFVYCELKYYGKHNHFLKDAHYLGEAKTASNLYVLKNIKFPVVFNNNKRSTNNQGQIRGEMYAVSPEVILQIDAMKNNGAMVKRSKRSFFLNDQSYPTKNGNKKPSVEAFMYVADDAFWKDANLQQCPIFTIGKDKTRKYYEYFCDRGTRTIYH